jgi:hypothetical protein
MDHKDIADNKGQTKAYKKKRFVTKLIKAATSGNHYRDTHVFIGGTGAVGGTALLQMLTIYEDMMNINPPGPNEAPILMATGKAQQDIDDIAERLTRFVESRHGKLSKLKPDLYVMHSGIFISFEEFHLTAIRGLEGITNKNEEERTDFVRSFLATLPNGRTDFDKLMNLISEARPMTDCIERYRKKLPISRQCSKFRSVIIGIPIPSLVTYHSDYLKVAQPHIHGLSDDGIEELEGAFRESLRKDLIQIRSLSREVLVAHTTAIGGMYDEQRDERGKIVPSIRLGFSHSAQDDKLTKKQKEAEEFTKEFSDINIKVLITAAAIGIDEVRVRKPVPMHKNVAEQLTKERDILIEEEPAKPLSADTDNDEPILPGKHIRIYPPKTARLDGTQKGSITFQHGKLLRPTFSIRSGENGFFSVSNADALYRVMRVASASELGHVMATVGLFGDDPLTKWFPNNICYYTEGENSRQVFDLLNQPQLLQMQLSGIEPMALQELGSAKHQGELHTLSLLILLHRLRTVDITAIDPYVNLRYFDPARFLIENSRPLTFEDLTNWTVDSLATEMRVLASAQQPSDLAKLNHVLKQSKHDNLFKAKKDAVEQVLDRVLKAVWMVPCLGSPILYEDDKGNTFVRTGYFVAPLAHFISKTTLVNDYSTIDRYFWYGYEQHRKDREERGEAVCTFPDYRDYNICSGGFVDLRRNAILCTAKHSDVPLAGRISHFSDEESLRETLLKLDPYSFFTTCGLVALLHRLQGLHHQLVEGMAELGTLHEYRWQVPRDANGHILVVPGAIEAFRMVSEGLEKTTGTERLDGIWGYEPRPNKERLEDLSWEELK